MKKLAVFLAVSLMLATFVTADVDIDKLKAAHIAAMKYHGQGDLLLQKDNKMIYLACGKDVASGFYSPNMATGYVENDKAKMYWTIERKLNYIIVVVFLKINGADYQRSFQLSEKEGELVLKDLNWKSGTRIDVDWDCIKKKFPSCALTCLGNWVMCLACIGEAAWKCVDWW